MTIEAVDGLSTCPAKLPGNLMCCVNEKKPLTPEPTRDRRACIGPESTSALRLPEADAEFGKFLVSVSSEPRVIPWRRFGLVNRLRSRRPEGVKPNNQKAQIRKRLKERPSSPE